MLFFLKKKEKELFNIGEGLRFCQLQWRRAALPSALPLKPGVRASLGLSFAQERERDFFGCILDVPTSNGKFCFAPFVPDKVENVIFPPCSRQVTREESWLVCYAVALGLCGQPWTRVAFCVLGEHDPSQ